MRPVDAGVAERLVRAVAGRRQLEQRLSGLNMSLARSMYHSRETPPASMPSSPEN